jgi:CDP-diacylglycerol--glycerol-3-phosphate 3-phosphatidyltransferase
MKKRIPNILSIVRLCVSASLVGFSLQRMYAVFIAVYCAIAVTDSADGYLARKWKVCSEIGAKLDGLGDLSIFLFGFASLVIMYFDPDPSRGLSWALRQTLPPLILAMAGKLWVFVFTKIRFGQWNMMHTYLNKALGVLLFVAVPLFVGLRDINRWYVHAVCLLAYVSVIEDTLILRKAKEYNVNFKGLLFHKMVGGG